MFSIQTFTKFLLQIIIYKKMPLSSKFISFVEKNENMEEFWDKKQQKTLDIQSVI